MLQHQILYKETLSFRCSTKKIWSNHSGLLSEICPGLVQISRHLFCHIYNNFTFGEWSVKQTFRWESVCVQVLQILCRHPLSSHGPWTGQQGSWTTQEVRRLGEVEICASNTSSSVSFPTEISGFVIVSKTVDMWCFSHKNLRLIRIM